MKKYTDEQIRFLAIRTIGNFLVLCSLLGMFLTFGPAVRNEIVYRFNRYRGITYVVQEDALQEPAGTKPQPTPTGKTFFRDVAASGHQVEVLTPVDTDFGIVIPKIAANSRVIPNVDASNYDSYMAALKIGVAHASGTMFPGQGGNIYLFAHSTDNFWNVGRYNAVFYLLKEVGVGDEVDLYYNGRRYIYIVTSSEIIEANDVAYLTEPTPFEQLTLQTCWPPGTTLKRLMVIAKPKVSLPPQS